MKFLISKKKLLTLHLNKQFLFSNYFLEECVYLVESIQKESKDDFGSADVENIFIILKPPYLIEKSDHGKV